MHSIKKPVPALSPAENKRARYFNRAGLLLAFAVLLYLASLPLELQEQFALGWSLIGFLILAKPLAFFRGIFGKVIFLLIVTFISLRYTWWRTFDTLIYTGPVDFVLMALVYLAEMQVSAVHYLSIFINLWPLERKVAPLPLDMALWPSVDVFIPTYNENIEITRITATAATLLDYPKDKLNIYILDDGSTEQRRHDVYLASTAWQRYRDLKHIADELGVGYLTRETNEHAKAGNLNAAMKRTSGELMLILDCDHVPTRDFLQNTVGWFLQDKKLFLVQTPHFFINPDPLEKRLGSFGMFPSEHEMFYRANQPAMDMWNASFFCGSAAVLRRKYIEEVGGIAGDTITEDAETALALHAKGYSSAYINRPMVCGLSPETLEGFIVQRTRWCQGMLQINILKNPLLIPGLSLPQRLNYLCAGLFWFFGFSRFFLLIAPTLFILFGWQIYHASFNQVLAYALPGLVNSFVVTDYLFAKYRRPLFSECYENLLSVFLLPAVIGVINNPRKPAFKVTPKGQNLDRDFLSPLIIPYILALSALLVALPIGIFKWYEFPMYRDSLSICLWWLIINIIISFASLGIFWERRQVRHHHRCRSQGKLWVSGENGSAKTQAGLIDCSLGGIRFELPEQAAFEVGDKIVIETSDSLGEVYILRCAIAVIVKQSGKQLYGCAFSEPEKDFSKIVQLVYGDSQRWINQWENRPQNTKSLLYMIYEFIAISMKGARYGLVGLFVFGKQKLKFGH